MKHSLDLNIICKTQSVLDALKAVLPTKIDPAVWDGDYSVPIISTDRASGFPCLTASIRFHDDVSRDIVLAQIQAIQGFFIDCEVGSYIQLHTCDHDLFAKSGCIVTTLYEVVL